MTKQLSVALCLSFATIVCSAPLSAQTTPPTRGQGVPNPAAVFAARRARLEGLLRSSDKDKIAQAFAGYKQWFSENAKEAENAFWYSRPLTMPLGAAGPSNTPGFASDILELVELSKNFKFSSDPQKFGWLFAI